MRLCKFTFTVISFLPCLHTFWHAIPTSFYIFNVFKSCKKKEYIGRYYVLLNRQKPDHLRSTMLAGLVVDVVPDYSILSTSCDGSPHSEDQACVKGFLQ